jgi:hypothetical protein
MTAKEKEGYELMHGAMSCLCDYILWGVIILLLLGLLKNCCGWDIDDSDQDSFHRSGLSIHRDAKTGVEYLCDGHGGMIERKGVK